MKVSIVIPTKNGGNAFEMLLQQIRNQKHYFNVEIMVVDSGSRDGTLEIASRFNARVVNIASRNFTHGGARNLGASHSKGYYLVFCNQDALPVGRNWLTSLISPLQEHGVGASYSRQVAPKGTDLSERVFLHQHYPPADSLHTKDALRGRGPLQVVLFSTVSGALRREVWERFRFRDDIIMSEDQELASRLLLAGYAIQYVADSIVLHSNKYSFRDAFRRYFDSGLSLTYLPFLRVSHATRSLAYLKMQASVILKQSDTSAAERLVALCKFSLKVLGFSLGQAATHMPERLVSRISWTRMLVSSG